MTDIAKNNLTTEDFSNNTKPRWCAGCGDFGIHSALKKAMAGLGVAPCDTAIISGIGCSSRIAYHMNGYCFHTVHGRPIAVASGVKIANPKLNVWVVTGDGDCLAIGGNHFIHALRRNVNLNIVLLNNRIYGLTKGQYSPTSQRGFVSKSSPYGTVEDPFKPCELTLAAGGKFYARGIATDQSHAVEILKAASNFKGAAVVELLQNCVTFNNGTYGELYTPEGRKRRAIYLEHGKPMLFGDNNEYGLVLDGFEIKAVKVGENGYSLDKILVHDVHCQDSTIHVKLSMMEGPDLPVALGVIRDVAAPTYDDSVTEQIEEVSKRQSYHNFAELVQTNITWTID